MDKIARISGIYEILNTINKKRYVGSAVNIQRRRKVHQSALQSGHHYNRHLQNAWNKYGEENFEFAVRFLCAPQDIIGAEQGYINYYKMKNLYNICPNAKNCAGRRHSAETRKEMSITRTGRICSAETRKKLSVAHTGKILSIETRKKIGQAKLGTQYSLGAVCSAETREKLRRANLDTKNPHYGKHHSLEAREKISRAHKGRTLSSEHRAKIGRSHKGKHHSPETIEKMCVAQRKRRANEGI